MHSRIGLPPATASLTMRFGVGCATLIGCFVYAACIAPRVGGATPATAQLWILASAFALITGAFAPIIADSIRTAKSPAERARFAFFWALVFPVITMWPVALAVFLTTGEQYVASLTTYLSWTAGAII